MIEIPFTVTLTSTLQGKLHHWVRRSLGRYFFAATAFAFGARLLGWTPEPGFNAEVFLMSLIGLIGISLMVVVLSAQWQAKSLRARGLDQLRIQFMEEGLLIRTGDKLEPKSWQQISALKVSDDGFRLQFRDGLFRHVYLQSQASQLPVETYVKLLALFQRSRK
jgi:hypothetical protein